MATTKTTKKTTSKKKAEGYKITVQGSYHAIVDKGRVPKFFEKEEFFLPKTSEYKMGQKWKYKEIKDAEGKVVDKKKYAVPNIIRENTIRCKDHIIRRYHIEQRLRERYPDFSAVRECEVVDIQRAEVDAALCISVRELSVDKMNEAQLLMFLAIHNMTINISMYPNLSNKRTAVKRAYESDKKQKLEDLEYDKPRDKSLDEPDGMMFDEGPEGEETLLD